MHDDQATAPDHAAIVQEARSLGIDVADDVRIEYFGATRESASKLGELVRSGRKTATASLFWAYEHENEALPEPGQREITIDWDGNLLAIIETMSVEVVHYREVDADWARLEGEGDLSLAHWRRVHWRFFEHECALIGREPSEDMPIVCQRFRVLYPAQA